LVSVGGELVAQVAQVVLDRAEGLRVGQVNQTLGHLVHDRVGGRVEALAEGLEPLFTPFGGLTSAGNGGI
jgi:hypothetical protein